VRLAKDQGARLRLVHVVDEQPIVSIAEPGVDLEGMRQSLVKAGESLLAKARRETEKAGVKTESVMYESVTGGPAAAILRDARKWKADLIVMGTHGRRGLRRMVLGSDAEQVVREATAPVMLVRAR
jgi:nucleotide-binding universal stress UspA family protein